ncbi:fungal chitosanase of glycosyl hydrolase group 75-domain-containing protein [Microdochium bolleyi]|uniref:Endo-chitosanase n=1 Tax=Microdochium bolleyi TaxID=196109 RepID=A0A136JF23_9PEZI|nr:fungal chitosanase of glycosyl hydrolase group 75-domain-containing protein [Microdochium bolleyi]
MDIDCDGATRSYDGDNRCDGSTDTQSQTSFKDELKAKHGIDDLNAYVHSYVVFGNTGSRPGYVNFDPRDHGISPLSVMAVICGDNLFYGVWGDENGDDGERAAVGESSIALATLCFGKDNVSGDIGHSEADVLYIAFSGEGAQPDAGVKWKTRSVVEFERSRRRPSMVEGTKGLLHFLLVTVAAYIFREELKLDWLLPQLANPKVLPGAR